MGLAWRRVFQRDTVSLCAQSDNVSHIDIQADSIDVVISHIDIPYAINVDI